MDKINFVNKGQPAINDTNLNKMQTNIENEFNKKNIIAVGFNSDYAMTSSNWTQKKLPFNKVISQVGNKLSLVDGGVKIGAGITKIKVSLQASCSKLGNDTFYDMEIRHNSKAIGTNDGRKVGDPQSWSFPIAPVIANVKEGDTIEAYFFADSANFRYDATQLVVEAIDYDE